MTQFINFEVENAEVIEEDNDSQFATAKIRAFSSDKNRHNLYCSEDTLKNTAPTIYNKPILYSIDKRLDDFYTHIAPEDNLIAGFVVPNQAEFERLDDGRLSLNVFAKIWKRYAPKVIELFKRDSNKKSVSVEMELFETSPMADGLDEMLKFAYAGITLLGDYITEASPGAKMQLLSFSEENEKIKKAYELEFGKYDEMDFVIPESIKKNAQTGLDYSKENNIGGTSVNLANGRYLLSREKVEPERVRQVYKKLSAIAKRNSGEIDESNSDYACWMMHGGNDGYSWSKEMVNKMDELDNKNVTYFDTQDITFPYSSLRDANPAIRGIDPPVTLEQANAIASQADAVGTDEKKNGWVIAISSFRETHKVVDGKWVKKEEKNMANEEKEKTKEFETPEDAKEKPDVEEMAEEKETPEEDKAESGKEEPEDKNMSEFSFDFADAYSMFSEDFEDYAAAGEAFCMEPDKANFAKMAYYMYKNMSAMKMKMAKMQEDSQAYMAQNEDLKKFKAEKDEEEFNFAVDGVLKEIEGRVEIPNDELDALREESKKYSLENIDIWKNSAKARAFNFSEKKNGDGEEFPVKKYGLPFSGKNRVSNGSPWKRN